MSILKILHSQSLVSIGDILTKYCTECGTKNLDEANFCSKCGKPLEGEDHSPFDANAPLEIPQKYNLYNVKETSSCFNCKQNTFIHIQKDGLLSNKVVYFCTNCGLTLEKNGSTFKIVDILDRNNSMWKMHNIQQFKLDDWENIANGALSAKDQSKREKEMEDLRERLFQLQMEQDISNISQDLIKGETYLHPVDSPAELKDNEEAYLSIPDIILSEPQISKKTSFETSFKLSKGVTVKSGAKKTTSAPLKKLKEIDTGTLVITNKRVIFVGIKKTVSIDLRKIFSINIFKDGISIQRENKKRIEYFTGTDQHTLTFVIEGREQTFTLEGNIVRAMILGLIAKL